MKQSLFSLVLILLSSIAWAQPASLPTDTFYRAIFAGEVAMRDGRPRQAVAPFQRALEIAQSSGLVVQVREAKIRLAKSNLHARNHRRAAELFEELLLSAGAADRASFHLGAGQAWKRFGQGKKAGLHFLAALKGPLSGEARAEATEQGLLCLAIELQRLEKKRKLFDAHGTVRVWFLD